MRSGGSAEVVLFRTGARFLLSGASTARVEPAGLQPGSGSAPKPLPRLGPDLVRRINTPARRISPAILGVLVRGTEDPVLGPRGPSPNGAVRAEPVTLRWAGPVEADQQHLVISNGMHTVHQAELPPAAREFRVPRGILRPGHEYVWSVTAVRDGVSGRQCRALLRILLPAERAEVARWEREAAAARSSAPDSPSYLLLLAEAYERLGLVDDARSAYEKVLRLRPDDAGVQAALQHLAPASHGS